MLLNRHNLNVAKVASKEQSRYTLQAILCTPEATVATDGHRLVHVTTPKFEDSSFPVVPNFEPSNGHTGRFLLSSTMALEISKALPKKTIMPILANAQVGIAPEGSTAIAVTDLDRPRVFNESRPLGNFPNYEMVIPKLQGETEAAENLKEQVMTIGLNANLLAELAKLAADFNGSKQPVIKLTLRGPNNAIRMDIDGGEDQHMTQVLMPVRF